MQPTPTLLDLQPAEPDASPLLSVRNLKTYFQLDEGIVRSVDGASFDVMPGQVVGIVGESGCGKSVTMKSILQILQPPGRIVDGEILFRRPRSGEVVDLANEKSSSRTMRSIRGAEIALIPQEPMAAFSPVHTVGDQVIEAIRLHRSVSKREARDIAVTTFREVGLSMPEQRLDSYSWELSGGLRQRAMIAMALSCRPTLLIADEPTTAIDVTTQAQILTLLRGLQQQRNMSIIFITHDLGVIAQIADFVVVMYLGRVMETGSVEDIFHNPKHPYTRALLESIPSRQPASRSRLPTVPGSIPHPFNRPSGCPFHPRCGDFMPGICDARIPALYPVPGDQPVSCFLHHDVEDTS